MKTPLCKWGGQAKKRTEGSRLSLSMHHRGSLGLRMFVWPQRIDATSIHQPQALRRHPFIRAQSTGASFPLIPPASQQSLAWPSDVFEADRRIVKPRSTRKTLAVTVHQAPHLLSAPKRRDCVSVREEILVFYNSLSILQPQSPQSVQHYTAMLFGRKGLRQIGG